MFTNDALTLNGDVNGLSHVANFLQQDEEEEEEALVSAAAENREETKQLQLLLQSINTTLFIHQLPPQGLSFQLWPAASTLVSLIDQNNSSGSPILPFLSRPIFQPNSKPIRILELGSGTGLVGIAAASLIRAHVTLTDLPHVLPNLQFNADANAAATASNGGTVDVHCLRWGDVDDMASMGHCFDLLLASDVVYHDHLFDPLLQTLSFFLQGDVVFVMAHLRRWKKDGIFFKKARKLFEVRIIHTDEPLPGSRTGVAVYHFTRKHQNNSKKPLVSVP